MDIESKDGNIRTENGNIVLKGVGYWNREWTNLEAKDGDMEPMRWLFSAR